MIDKSVCKKVVSMLSLYVENKLDIEDKIFVENHFKFTYAYYRHPN